MIIILVVQVFVNEDANISLSYIQKVNFKQLNTFNFIPEWDKKDKI